MNRFTFGALLVALAVLAIAPCSAEAETEGTGWEAFCAGLSRQPAPGRRRHDPDRPHERWRARRARGAITVTDTLPEGVTATAAGGMTSSLGIAGTQLESKQKEEEQYGGQRWDCEGIGSETVTCTSNPAYLKPLPIGRRSGRTDRDLCAA